MSTFDSRAHSMDSAIDTEKEIEDSPRVVTPREDEANTPPLTKEPSVQPVPNGGVVAWLQVLGSFFLFFSSWGLVNTFGVYQTYYDSGQLFKSSSSTISWIGTVQGFLLVVVGALTGVLFDRGFFRSLTYSGVFLVVFGMMMTSISKKYYQVFLSQAVVSGLGQGFLFIPSVAIIPTYFVDHRALATGIAASGSSLGGVIMPIVFERLQTRIGFGWATRVLAFISLGTLAVSVAVMKQRSVPSKPRSLIDRAAFKSAPFVFFSIGLTFIFIGLYVPFFFMTAYANLVLHVNSNTAFYLLPILNAASAFGRIGLNFVADEFGALNTLLPAVFISAILCFVWIGVKSSLAGLIVLCIFYGFFSGAVVSLPPTVIASFTPEVGLVGTWMGMSFTFTAIGLLIGNPIAGALLNLETASFEKAQAFAGGTVMAGALFMAAARVMVYRQGKGWKS